MEPVSPFQSRTQKRRRRRLLKVLPSLFTLGNLLCGFAAIFYASRIGDLPVRFGWRDIEAPLVLAAGLVFLGMLFDALDGRVARLTKQTSELGEQLDSMADMVTFGVAPAFLAIQLIGIGVPFWGEEHPRWNIYFDRAVLVIAGVYVACAALRLARFNIEIVLPEEKDHMSFKGLPSPAAAGTVCSLVLLHQWLLGYGGVIVGEFDADEAAKVTAVIMVVIALLSALAMVSTLRYSHVMNRFLRDRAPAHYIAAIVCILIPLLTLPQLTLAFVFVTYAVSAPVMALLKGKTAAPIVHHAEPVEKPHETPVLKIKQP